MNCFAVFQDVSVSVQLGTSSDITVRRRHLNRHMSPGQTCAGVHSSGRAINQTPEAPTDGRKADQIW